MKKEKPKIELYMYSLNQEFPVKVGHFTFLKRHSETYQEESGKVVGVEQVASQVYGRKQEVTTDWPAQWIHNKWIENYTKTVGIFAEDVDPLKSVLMRSEDFGGILFDVMSDRIYKVNVSGYELFQEILNAHQKNELSKFRSREFEQEDVECFIEALKVAGLWPR